jgi:hypothetical protein
MLLLAGTPAGAQSPVTPEAFEAMSEGRTLHFTLDGLPFGSEQYFPGRRSLWRFADGTCDRGGWWAEGERICFAYDGHPEPQCWRFLRDGDRFRAELADGDGALVLDLSRTDDARLPCPAPDLGA